jgi:hypothetical protein
VSVLQPEGAEQILAEATAKAVKQAGLVRKNAYNESNLFDELVNAVKMSGMLRSTSRFIVGKHIEKPYLDAITAKGLYKGVLDLVDESQLAYLTLVQSLLRGENQEKSIQTFRTSMVIGIGDGKNALIATLRMPTLKGLEVKGVLQSQEAGYFRMASEIDERVLEQYRGTHG